ncbi:MAG: acetate--CoA ligase family protein [Alphaproteobacteria bacterium]
MASVQLDKLLRPQSFALVGATEREHTASVRILRNLKRGSYPGRLYPINPRYQEVLGVRCYPSLAALPEIVDAVFIAIAAEDALGVLEDAGKLGIKAALINGTGFADGGPDGVARQDRLVAIARSHGMAVCGPNNSGYINLWDRTSPSTFYALPPGGPGPVAAITQSGSVAIALCQDDRQLGLGYVITAGNEAVCGVADYLDFVVRDDRIKVVMLFLEVLREPARFAAAALEAARRNKRIIVTRVGRSESGRAAVAAHSGALAGDDAVYDAFFRKYGIVRAADIDEMIETATLFTAYPNPPPKRHVVPVTLSGGEAGLIADLAAERDLDLPDLSPPTLERLRPHFASYFTPRNPLDAFGLGWNRERFVDIVDALVSDPAIGVVAHGVDASSSGLGDTLLTTEIANIYAEREIPGDKRIVFFTNMAGGGINQAIKTILDTMGIPYLCGMRPSVGALSHWVNYRAPATEASIGAKPAAASGVLPAIGCMAEAERFALMRAAGVPMVETVAAGSADEAVAAAKRLGYPVAIKGTAPSLLHKTEHDLIRLALTDEGAVRAAYSAIRTGLDRHAKGESAAAVVVQPMAGAGIELILGVRNDPRFGSIIVAGLGGTLVEIVKEASLRIGPVDEAEARAMLGETKAGTLLAGVRGKGPYDIDAAARAIAALSRFGAAHHGQLASVEINPLIVLERGKGALGVDVLLEPTA